MDMNMLFRMLTTHTAKFPLHINLLIICILTYKVTNVLRKQNLSLVAVNLAHKYFKKGLHCIR